MHWRTWSGVRSVRRTQPMTSMHAWILPARVRYVVGLTLSRYSSSTVPRNPSDTATWLRAADRCAPSPRSSRRTVRARPPSCDPWPRRSDVCPWRGRGDLTPELPRAILAVMMLPAPFVRRLPFVAMMFLLSGAPSSIRYKRPQKGHSIGTLSGPQTARYGIIGHSSIIEKRRDSTVPKTRKRWNHAVL